MWRCWHVDVGVHDEGVREKRGGIFLMGVLHENMTKNLTDITFWLLLLQIFFRWIFRSAGASHNIVSAIL